MKEYNTLDEIRGLPVAHTDAGDFFIHNGQLKQEFLAIGIITKIRAGLFFITIDNQRFSTPKRAGFKEGEEVVCVLLAHQQKEQDTISFTIKGLEKKP